jgi:hypothetical protein
VLKKLLTQTIWNLKRTCAPRDEISRTWAC